MFIRSFASKDRAGKTAKKISKRSFRDDTKRKMLEKLDSPVGNSSSTTSPSMGSPGLTSAIVTLVIGPEQRLFAAHEDVLTHSPFFAVALRGQFFEADAKRIDLPDEEPEVLSCVLEYLYKGDYTPRLVHDKRRNAWVLEGGVQQSPQPDQQQDPSYSPRSNKSYNTTTTTTTHTGGGGGGARFAANNGVSTADPTVYLASIGEWILRDTAVYCAAERYGLDELKRLALRKQGLQSGVEVATVLRSARYAYAYTPDSDSRLRAHYLALIIRSRRTFKRSGTMQLEMEMGGKLFFDLFVAMCNHMDDIAGSTTTANGYGRSNKGV